MSTGSNAFRFWRRRNGTEHENDTANGDERQSHSKSVSRSASPEPRGGERTLADSEYARKRRELLQLARDLESLGASELIDVPRIVVIGAQSTGKSSLVEAVTGINVPRDSGTCTRCPMECTITTLASTWSCTISLRIISREHHSAQRFSPELTSPGEVELWIRRAQAAVLSPHRPRTIFMDKSREELKALSNQDSDPDVLAFTNSVVVIDIADPSGADLSFVDLPGLIENADDPTLVPLVEDVVKQYISRESTVILTTIPASDDLEIQKALRLAKEADPSRKRTVGVVTKPDQLTSGDTGKRESWKKLFKGEESKHQLQRGYYCVRLPNDQERSQHMSRERTRQMERRFFDENAPWKDLENRRRLGIPRLIHDISELLMEIIREAIPKMRTAAAAQLAKCRVDLSKLPPLLSADATAEVIRCVFEFCKSMEEVIDGKGEDKSFVHQCRHAFHLFERAIRRTAPDFRPADQPYEIASPVELPGDVDAIEDSDEVPMEATPTAESDTASIAEGRSRNNTTESAYFAKGPAIGLREVREVIRDCTGWELPHNVPYEAKERLIRNFMKHWPVAEKDCYDRVASALLNATSQEVIHHFGRFPPLESLMRSIMTAQLQLHVSSAQTIIENAVAREHKPYGTQNNSYFEAMRRRWIDRYMGLRGRPQHYNPASYGTRTYDLELTALNALHSLGFTNLRVSEFYRLYPPDPYEDEIIVMADVRSYFHVVYKRISDDVPEAIKLNLLQKFVGSLQSHIVDKLQLGTPDAGQRMQELLMESPAIAKERARLTDRLRRLEEITARLDAFRL